MKITPAANKILIKVEKPKIGALDISSRDSAIEVGTIEETGKNVTEWKKGDKLFFKSYGLAQVEYGGEHYRFIDITSEAIQAKVDE